MTDFRPALNLPPVTSDEPCYCQNCERWFSPSPSWLCDCGQIAAFAVQPGTCLECRQPALHLRNGCSVRSLCRCTLTAEQRVALEGRWRELEDEEAQGNTPRPRPRQARPELADDAPPRDWWPALAELLPAHIDRAVIRDHLELLRCDYPLAQIVAALRRVLERIARRQTSVGSPAYITSALARELGQPETRKDIA